MVTIRLKRGGTRSKPFYRIVAIDKRNARDGKNLDIIGYYNPLKSEHEKVLEEFKFDEEKLLDWYKKGARLSHTVKRLVSRAGLTEKLAR